MKVVIIDYGAGNVFSVTTALQRLGVQAVLSSDVRLIARADRVIFPGVGQAAAAMNQLKDKGLDRIIPQLEMPVLGICLGMQLMCRFSEEENTWGLGIFPMEVKKFTDSCKVPHMGWNTVRKLKTTLFQGINPGEWMYFVHSYMFLLQLIVSQLATISVLSPLLFVKIIFMDANSILKNLPVPEKK